MGYDAKDIRDPAGCVYIYFCGQLNFLIGIAYLLYFNICTNWAKSTAESKNLPQNNKAAHVAAGNVGSRSW